MGAVAALVARSLSPDVLDAAMFSHVGPEKGHALILHTLGVEPYLSLALQLSEGVGAVLAVALLESALNIYRETASMDEAFV